MSKEIIILFAEDNEGQALLVQMNLKKAGIRNKIIHFWHGGEVLDFLYKRGDGQHRQNDIPYLLLLDIRMPVLDGNEVLEKIKSDPELHKMPVIMLTTTDDPDEINHCHELGCNAYIVKPVDGHKFIEAVKTLGLFLTVVAVPDL